MMLSRQEDLKNASYISFWSILSRVLSRYNILMKFSYSFIHILYYGQDDIMSSDDGLLYMVVALAELVFRF